MLYSWCLVVETRGLADTLPQADMDMNLAILNTDFAFYFALMFSVRVIGIRVWRDCIVVKEY